MPELPEVQTVVDTLRPGVVGQLIRRVQLNRPDVLRPLGFELESAMINRRIEHLFRRGKKIVIQLDDGAKWVIHLGMTGRLTVQQPEDPTLPHTHLVIVTTAAEIRFRDPRRFGGVWWLGIDGSVDGNLGPEPLLTRPRQLASRLARTTRAIKSTLLDQRVLAGLGNIYVDESLFKAGIHPLHRSHELSAEEVGRLNRAIKTTLRRAIRHRGSTLRDYFDANGNAGAFQKLHAVYDRAGQPCHRCRTPVEQIVLSGRSTHFCPTCQKRLKCVSP